MTPPAPSVFPDGRDGPRDECGVFGVYAPESEVARLANTPAESIQEAIEEVVPRLEGAFSTVVLTSEGVFAFRDPAGLRPLALGRLGDRYVVASESCAFDIIGAEFMREVLPGEMI